MYNNLVVVGRLTKDPELKNLPSGTELCTGSVACDYGYGDRKDTLFLDFVCFGKQGGVIAEYAHKGDLICFDGELQESKWEDKEGNKRSRPQLKINRIKLMPNKREEKQEKQEYSYNEPPADFDDPGAVPF